MTTKKLKRDETDVLYEAAAAYVRSKGGSVLVAGGIQIIQWPGDLGFSLAVKCIGKKPLFAEGEQDHFKLYLSEDK